MSFVDGQIDGIYMCSLQRHIDKRGFLIETFRLDNLPDGTNPAMSYVSYTEPGIGRGPHEHIEQTDVFAFVGPGEFRIYLWDNRKSSNTFQHRRIITGGDTSPILLVVPPGVVHGYKNITVSIRGMVINYPDRLYAGWLKKQTVDEIRHEEKQNDFYEDFIRS